MASGTRIAALLAASAALLAACTSGPEGSPEQDPGGPTAAPTPSVEESPDPACGEGERLAPEPLAVVAHQTRRPLRLGVATARRLLDGSASTWAELGAAEPGDGPVRVVGPVAALRDHVDTSGLRALSAPRALRTVVRERDVVAVVPASAVDARVRVASVEGVDPLRRPRAYPLRGAEACLPRPVTLTVAGDVMLARRVEQAAGGEPGSQLRAMAPRLAAADVTVGNLESTLDASGPPTQGGDSFVADPAILDELDAAGFDVLGLANNHLGDFGETALVRTVRRLRAADFATFGAGRDGRAARRPAVVDRGGTSFGFVGFNAIGETPYAGPDQPGAVSVSMPPRTGPLDEGELRRFLRDVRRLDRRVDVVVAMPHWGTQYTNRPEPVQRAVARRIVAAGADLVVGGHPHWPQGTDLVDGVVVAHSLGNLVFDMDFMAETMRGLLLETTWWGDELRGVRFVPYAMDSSFTPRVVGWQRGLASLELMWEASRGAFAR